MQWMRRGERSVPVEEPPVGRLSLARPTLAALRVGVLVLDDRVNPPRYRHRDSG